MEISLSTIKRKKKEAFLVKYLIYAVFSRFQICCHLGCFPPNQYSQNSVYNFFFFFSSQVSASTLKLCLNCPCRGKWKLLIVSIHFTNGCTLVLYKQLIQTGSVLMLLPLFSLLNFPLYKDTANVRADTHHTCPIGYSDKIVDWSRNFSRASQ